MQDSTNALDDWPVWAEGNYTEVFSKRIQTYEYVVVPMYQNFNIQWLVDTVEAYLQMYLAGTFSPTK